MGKMVMGCSKWVLGLVVLALIEGNVNAISCQDAITNLLPCLPYLGGVGDITAPCCQGAQALNQIATSSKPEIKSLCICLKQAAASTGVNINRAKQLPQLCHINVPVPIDPNVDCNNI